MSAELKHLIRPQDAAKAERLRKARAAAAEMRAAIERGDAAALVRDARERFPKVLARLGE